MDALRRAVKVLFGCSHYGFVTRRALLVTVRCEGRWGHKGRHFAMGDWLAMDPTQDSEPIR